MKQKNKAKAQLINELAGPPQPIEDVVARETGLRQAEFVSNVYL